MVRLALPGLVMVEAECLAFEILTLAASYFDTSHLAAQSVLSTVSGITFQYVFSVSRIPHWNPIVDRDILLQTPTPPLFFKQGKN